MRRTVTTSAADDVVINSSIYRRKQTSPIGKVQQVLRRRSLKLESDVDASPLKVDAKRRSAPVVGADSEVRYSTS